MKNEYKPPKILKDLGMLYATISSKQKSHYCIYECGYCGVEFKAQTGDINNRTTISCGCQRKINSQNILHGLTKHPLYDTWRNMIKRCTNPKDRGYKNYGGRGISVCMEWLDVKNFIQWAEPTYIEGYTLDRINNDGNYEPSNCRWADRTTQALNKRKAITNTSGIVGADFNKNEGKYQARISVMGNRIFIGKYPTIEEAAQARDNYIIENNLPHKLSTEY